MSGLCELNVDCDPYVTNKLCFTLFPEVPDVDATGCKCNPNFGWTGSDCTELSLTSYVIIGGNGVLMLTSMLCSVTLFYLFSLMLCNKKRLKVRSSRNLRDDNPNCITISLTNRGFTLLLTFFSTVFTSCWAALEAVNPLIIDGPPIGIDQTQSGFSDGEYGSYGRLDLFLDFIATPVALVLGFLAVVNIALIWLEIAETTKHMVYSANSSSVRRKRRYVRAFQLFAVLLMFGSNILDRLLVEVDSLIGIILLPVGIIIIIAYIIGYHKLAAVIRTNASTRQAFKSVTDNARWTMRITTLGMAIFTSVWFAQSVISNITDFREFSGRWPVEPEPVLEVVKLLGVNILVFGVTRFLWKSRDSKTTRRRKSERDSKVVMLGTTPKKTTTHYAGTRDASVSDGPITDSQGLAVAGGTIPPRARRVKSPRDLREEKKRSEAQSNEKSTDPENVESEEDDSLGYTPQPYENVKEAVPQGPPPGRTRRIKSPRALREEEELKRKKMEEQIVFDLDDKQISQLYDDEEEV